MVLLRLLQRKRKATGSSTWERTPPSPLGTDGRRRLQEQHFTLPLGTWAGRVGALMGKDLLAIFEAFKAPLCSALSLPPEQVDAVLQELPQEWNAYHTSYTYIETHGQHGEVSHE